MVLLFGMNKLVPIGALLALILAISAVRATVSGAYTVNVHFVPAIVYQPCPVGQFWSPRNVPCGLCFCLTGYFSRCIPQPGCDPAGNGTSNSTPAPGSSGTTSNSTQTPILQPENNQEEPASSDNASMNMPDNMEMQSPPAENDMEMQASAAEDNMVEGDAEVQNEASVQEDSRRRKNPRKRRDSRHRY